MSVNYAAGNYFRDRMAEDELRRQDIARQRQEKEHSKGWWKRGLGQGIMGALPGLITLNPIQAAAGAVGGFGGEAINHFAFKDKQPGIAGNAAALASLGSGAATRGLFSGAANKAGIGGLEKAAAGMGNSDVYAKEMQLARMGPGLGGAPELAGPAMPGGAKFDAPINAQTTGAAGLPPTETMGPPITGANPRDVAFWQWEQLSPEEQFRRMQMMGLA